MKNPWFRMYTEAVDDEKLRLLAFEDRWHFVAILCCKGKGILDDNAHEMMRRKVAVKLGLQLRELEEVARRLEDVGLIVAETLQPCAWDSRQFQSDSSKDRVKAYRERKKRYSNVTVTVQDTDTDTDTDKEIKEKKRFKKPTLQEITDYQKEIGFKNEATNFFNYYESNGWMVGRTKMKNWKAAFSGWCNRSKNFASNKQTGPSEAEWNNADFMSDTNEEPPAHVYDYLTYQVEE